MQRYHERIFKLSYLEGEDAVRAAQLDDADLSEGAAPDDLQDLEVVLAEPQRLDAVRHPFHCKGMRASRH